MRRLLIGLGVVLALGGAALAAALFWIQGDTLRPEVEAALGKALGREVRITELDVRWKGSLEARGLHIADDKVFSNEPFITTEQVQMRIALWPLLSRREVRLLSLHLTQPGVRLQQRSDGRWNFSSLGGTADKVDARQDASPVRVSIDELVIEQGRLDFVRAGDAARSFNGLQLRLRDFDPDRASPFELGVELPGSGRLDLEGRVGPLAAGDPAQSPVEATLKLEAMDLARSALLGEAGSVSGRIDGALSLTGERGRFDVRGGVSAASLRLLGDAEPPDAPIKLDVEADYDIHARSGTIRRATLGAGGVGVQLDGTMQHADGAMALDLQLDADDAPVDDLQTLLPIFGVALPEDARLAGGSLSLDLEIRGSLDALVIRGPVTLRDSTLVGFGLGRKLSALSALAGLPAPSDTRIEEAAFRLHKSQSGTRVDELDARIAELGRLQGAGAVSPEGALDFKLRLKVDEALAERSGGGLAAGTEVGRVTGGALRYAATRGIGVTIGGDLGAPQVKADSSALAGSVISGLLNRADDDDGEGHEADRESSRGEALGSALFQLLQEGKSKKRQSDDDED